MKEFHGFKQKIHQQFEEMTGGCLFVTDVNRDELWDTYMDSFPEGTNLIFRERREYDCQCCKQFIRACGNVVSIVDNKLVSIWDIDIGGHFQIVANALSALVKSNAIKDIFFHPKKKIGTDKNLQELENKEILEWSHFHFYLPSKFVKSKGDIPSILSEIRGTKDVFKRSMKDISLEATETVLGLIDQNSIYRGEEFRDAVDRFSIDKKESLSIDQGYDNWLWQRSIEIGNSARIRNTAIGTLLIDISSDVGLDDAVKMFESKVAPTNYKRPSALITKNMISNAQKKVVELGIEDSLSRRYAIAHDITVNNVLFADRSAKKDMGVFDILSESAPDNIKNLDKVDEVTIDTFIKNILPKSENIDLMFENRHSNNLMSLIAPQDHLTKNIFKWDNNFSWAYNGEVADSMKERVKKAGGDVSGILRFSIQWNDGDDNQNDFDAHATEPNGNLISFRNKRMHPSSGKLDVDITSPGKDIAVENITWTDLDRMQKGRYKLLVHNFAHNGGKTGFTAEIEYDGQVYSYSYAKELRHDEKVVVAVINFNRETGIKFIESLPSTNTPKEIWGISTENFRRVSMIMNSPNHWDGNKTGNRHTFFILEKCKNDKSARGFFNEFLKEDLRDHRKVFEVLASKMRVEKSDNQLSGLGFSSTQRNSILCRISGSFSRIIKINF
jgi:hypothetical protein